MRRDKLQNVIGTNEINKNELNKNSTDNNIKVMSQSYIINGSLQMAIENATGIFIEFKEDMESLRGTLNLSYDNTSVNIKDEDSGIDALRGLEAAVNITSLYLQGNEINTVDELTSLTQLTWLDISDNYIEDISLITENLINLQGLVVDNNKLIKNDINNTILPSFEKLTSLEVLRLNNITTTGLTTGDFENISSLDKVYTIDLCNNGITSIGSSTNPLIPNLNKILSLGLSDNNIDDISALQGLESIENLCLSNNLITTLIDLSNASNLQELYLDGNKITRIGTNISTLKNLELLSLDDNKVEDLENLPIMSESGTLYLNNCNVSSLNILQENKRLGVLELKDNNIEDLSPIKDFNLLQILSLDNNKIKDIGVLKNLINLTAISLNNNYISDISQLKSIENYILEQNQINKTNNTLTISAINEQVDINIEPIINGITTLNLTNMIKDIDGNIPNIPNVYPPIKGVYNKPIMTWTGVDKNDVLYFQFDNYPTTTTSYFNGEVIQSIINIDDENLKAALNKKLNKEPVTSDITKAELESLTGEIDLSNNNISNLEGLQYAINITRLNLSQNNLINISQLASMTNLTWINISSNHIVDLSPLLGLPLEQIISNTQIIQYENRTVNMNDSLIVSLDYITGNSNGVVIDISNISNSGTWDKDSNNIVWESIIVGGIYSFEYNVEFGDSAMDLDDENIMLPFALNIQSYGKVTFSVSINTKPTRGVKLF